MSVFSLSAYRAQWPRIGGVLALGVGGAATLAAGKLTKPQLLSALNVGALLVHQYEEYQDPGYFPGQFNRGIFKSDSPRTYPLNANTALWINTATCYPVYIVPVLFPKRRWLGLAPALFGIAQAGIHGILFPRRARIGGSAYTYSPGALSALLLHVPLGLAYIAALREDGPIGRADWAKGVAYMLAVAALGFGAPNALLNDECSPYAFTEAQMGPYNSTPPTTDQESDTPPWMGR